LGVISSPFGLLVFGDNVAAADAKLPDAGVAFVFRVSLGDGGLTDFLHSSLILVVRWRICAILLLVITARTALCHNWSISKVKDKGKVRTLNLRLALNLLIPAKTKLLFLVDWCVLVKIGCRRASLAPSRFSGSTTRSCLIKSLATDETSFQLSSSNLKGTK